tara:strand:- start:2615 stop:2815 length:201 start_codon:yes stop_codon:yes gene_type:complete
MFNWFKKKDNDATKNLHYTPEIQDSIEDALWEIKEEYDLPTEEVQLVVEQKRKNVEYLHQEVSKRK